MNTKIKVKRLDLLEAVKVRKDTDLADYEKNLAKYEAAAAGITEKRAAFFDKLAADLRAGKKVPTDGYELNRKIPSVGCVRPNKPTQHDHIIRQLEMSVDELLTINAQDYSRYI